MQFLHRRLAAGGLAVLAAIALSGCAAAQSGAGTGVLAPIVRTADSLQGATVRLPMNTVLVVGTGSLAVDSYTATIADPAVVAFTQGHDDGSARFNPGFEPLELGSTAVTLRNAQGGIQPIEFTISVVAAPGDASKAD